MHSAYLKIGENKYKEIFGLDFEQFEIGQVFKHRPGITISQQDNTDEAMDTMNSAQLHYDQHYASQTEWKQCLGVSTMTLQKVLGATWKTFARKDRVVEYESIAMTAPVFAGDTLYAETTILDKKSIDESLGELQLETKGVNQAGKVVAEVKYRMKIYKKSKHPYYGKLQGEVVELEPRFSAYHTNSESELIEQVGLYFEDLIPGENFEHSPCKVLAEAEAINHALRSLNWDSRFFDNSYCQTYFDEPVAPVAEIYAVCAYAAITARTFGRVVANLGWTDIKMKRHIYPNERFIITSEIIDKRESSSRPTQGIAMTKTIGADEKTGEEVFSYNRNLLVYKKGQGPYENAGY